MENNQETIISEASKELKSSNTELDLEDNSKEKFKFSRNEIIWYSIFSIIFISGLTLCILGVCAMYITPVSTNPLFLAMRDFSIFLNRTTILDWRILGSIIMIIAMVGFIISVTVYTNKYIKEKTSKKKYKERLKILMSSDIANLDKQESLEKEKEKQAN